MAGVGADGASRQGWVVMGRATAITQRAQSFFSTCPMRQLHPFVPIPGPPLSSPYPRALCHAFGIQMSN